MKVVLHFGMPKTGSTALQSGLAAARPALTDAGILYPQAPVIGHSANFLMAGLLPPEKQPRYVRQQLRGEDDVPARFQGWVRGVRRRAARIGAHTLVLSAENLWNLAEPAPALRLRAVLEEMGATRIEALAYVRRPSDWYLSAVQQVLRASHRLKPPGPVTYRAPIETIATHVAAPGATRIFAFDRDSFPGGDILNHFRDTVLPGAPLPAAGGARVLNETLSAEGMALLQDYRAAVHPRANGLFTRDSGRFRTAILRAEPLAGGPTRPRLDPAVAERLDQGSPDLLWLAGAYGLRFDGIDYGAIGARDWPDPPGEVAGICPVDPDRKRRLGYLAVHELARPATAPRLRDGASGAEAPAGPGD